MSAQRIFLGLYLILVAVAMTGLYAVPSVVIGIVAAVAAVATLVGL